MKIRFSEVRTIVMATALAAALGACAGSPSKESAGEMLDDSVITSKVKGALLQAKDVNSMDITVETFKGRVLLSGFVSSPDERQRIEGVTRSVGGVKEISNKIQVK